jgi:16S rRNA (guanine(966)-N(2))-methyltransferase RsmD
MRIIAGEARGRRLLTPSDKATRPPLDRIREAIFTVLEGTFEQGVVLDLFAGTGSFGLEAVSRGARSCVFVEKSRESLALLQRNITSTGFSSRCRVLQGNALRVPDLGTLEPSSLSLVFLDPPFESFQAEESTAGVFSRLGELLQSPALRDSASVLLRHPSRYTGEYPAAARETRRFGMSVVARFVHPCREP